VATDDLCDQPTSNMSDRHPASCLVAAVALVAACGDSLGFAGGVGHRSIPTTTKLIATAYDDTQNRIVDCSLYLELVIGEAILSTPTESRFRARFGGEAKRFVTAPDGSGVGFWAEVPDDKAIVRLPGADSLEIRSPTSETASERFWREFSVFAGTAREQRDKNVLAEGPWLCQPMDVNYNNYDDSELTAKGRWQLVLE
jgi:hypothetical protein